MNLTVIIVLMIIVTLAMAFVTIAVIFANNMEFDDVVDATANVTKIIPNQSSRVVTQILEGG